MFHRWLVLVATLICLAPGLAPAQDNPAYQSAYDRGQKAFSENNFPVCAEEFRQAFNIEPRGNLLYNIAFCYEKANDLGNAISFYQQFVSAVPTSPKRPAIQRHIVELQGQAQDQFEEVSVTSDPPGANVYIDDKSKGAMGATPLNFKLLPGTYLIICESDGFEPARRKVELKKGAAAQLDMDLIPSAQVGTVNLMVTERDADILVDKKRVGRSPLAEPLRLKQGKHDLMVTKDTFTSWNQSVDVVAGKTVTLKVDLSGTATAGGDSGGGEAGGGGSLFGGDRLLPTITMGAGLAVVAGGVVTALSANGLYKQLKDKKKKGEPIAAQDISTGKSRVLMTNVLWGAGGAAAIGGAVWFFLAGHGGAAVPDIGVTMTPDGSAGVWGTF